MHFSHSLSFVIQYLAWRVLTGLHEEVTLSFMLVGHTKFAPDWCFGLFKQRYRRTFSSSLGCVAGVVDTSADVNVAQLVGDQEGEPIVPVYDWASFLGSHFKSVPQLKRYHHFVFSAAKPGETEMREFSESASVSFTMMIDNWHPLPHQLPHRIIPAGLSSARQWYLYRQIREYCKEEMKDLVCPKPSVEPDGAVDSGAQVHTSQDSPHPPPPPPPKKARRCGSCGKTGHSRRTCKNTSS